MINKHYTIDDYYIDKKKREKIDEIYMRVYYRQLEKNIREQEEKNKKEKEELEK